MPDNTIEFSMEDLPVMKDRTPTKRRDQLVKPIVEYTSDGIFVAAYNSAKEAFEATGINSSYISSVCRGKPLWTGKNTGHRIFLFRGDDIADRIAAIDKVREDYLFKHPTVHGKEVYEYTLGGRFLCKHPTHTIAAALHKTTSRIITNCCKGIRLFHEKRIFLYADGNIKERVKQVKAELYRLSHKRPKYREVDEYSLDGKFIKAYPSASAAARECGIHVSNICRCCSGIGGYGRQNLTTGGRIFLWVGDSISDRLELIKETHSNSF